jgi:hypothetical protein
VSSELIRHKTAKELSSTGQNQQTDKINTADPRHKKEGLSSDWLNQTIEKRVDTDWTIKQLISVVYICETENSAGHSPNKKRCNFRESNRKTEMARETETTKL